MKERESFLKHYHSLQGTFPKPDDDYIILKSTVKLFCFGEEESVARVKIKLGESVRLEVSVWGEIHGKFGVTGKNNCHTS